MIIPPQDYYSEYSSEQYSDGHPMYEDDIGGGGGVPPELIGPLMEVMKHPHNMYDVHVSNVRNLLDICPRSTMKCN